MNRGELETAIRLRLGVTSTDPLYSDTVLDDLIRASLAYISSLRDWPWLDETYLFTTAAGDNTENMPSGWVRVRSLTIDGYPAEEVTMSEIRTYDTDYIPARTSFYVYAVYENVLYFKPTPTAAGTANNGVLDYVKSEPALSSDSSEPLLPSRFHDAIVEYATAICFRRAGNVSEADAAFDAYSRWERRMLDETRRSHGPKQVRVRPGAPY